MEENQPMHQIQNSGDSKENTPGGSNGKAKKYLSFAWEFLKIIIIAAIIVFPIRYFIFQPFIVKGESMHPNFESGDYLIVDELSYGIGHPQRGDVVVFKYPLDTTQNFIKRVIGLPGETIVINSGKIEISKDGKKITLDEKKYLPDSFQTLGDVNITLEQGQYFVMGDNRQYSYDSRRWGILPKDDIIGKALFRLLPVSNLSLIHAPNY